MTATIETRPASTHVAVSQLTTAGGKSTAAGGTGRIRRLGRWTTRTLSYLGAATLEGFAAAGDPYGYTPLPETEDTKKAETGSRAVPVSTTSIA
jgi:hypothetical protein